MEALKLAKVERFALKKYQGYQQKGLPVRLITGSGKEVHIIADHVGVNKDRIIVETEVQYSKYSNNPYTNYWDVSERGTTNDHNNQNHVFIYTGPLNFKRGDIIIYGSCAEDGFYFMAVFDGIFCLEGKNMPGFGLQWCIDCRGQQFDHCRTFHDIDHSLNDRDFYVRRATEQEEDQYWSFIEAAGWRLDEEQRRLVCFPKVGQPYWTVELQDGQFLVVEHEAPKTEDERPIHGMCFGTESRAKQFVKDFTDKLKE